MIKVEEIVEKYKGYELGGVAKNSATFPSMLVIMKNKNI